MGGGLVANDLGLVVSVPAEALGGEDATLHVVGVTNPAPPNSGFTYAVEYSVDEALAAGARQVRFSAPVIGYVENFLGLRLRGVLLHTVA